jgi:hypothetical protein
MRLADSNPPHCSHCLAAKPEGKFVDFEINAGPVLIDPETRIPLPWDYSYGDPERLYLCETCLREACEIVNLKPERNTRQLREIRKQELKIEYLQDRVKEAEAALEKERAINLEAAGVG